MYRDEDSNSGWIIAIIIIVVVINLAKCSYQNSYKREVVATVTDKAVKVDKNESKYLIFTENNDGEIEVYEITDTVVHDRFNSSDVYAGIKIGKTYKFTIVGERNELFSWYPNILDYEEVE